MFQKLRSRTRAAAIATGLLLFAASPTHAGWVTIRNDTDNVLVVQEVCVVNNKPCRGKPYRLLPGEEFREFQPNPTVKRIEITDLRAPNMTLFTGPVAWKDDNQTFSIRRSGDEVKVAGATATPRR